VAHRDAAADILAALARRGAAVRSLAAPVHLDAAACSLAALACLDAVVLRPAALSRPAEVVRLLARAEAKLKGLFLQPWQAGLALRGLLAE
jgi:hypothetical protein